MWPFSERRSHKRKNVRWSASLICRFADLEQTVPVTVTDVSLGGVRLHLESMQVGPYHLLVSTVPVVLELAIDVPQGLIRSSIEFRWYDQPETEGLFVVGTEFVKMAPESKTTLKLAIKSL